jgi:DNA-binding IclR family transcriptional regulator
MRRRTDRLFPRSLGPRETEAVRLVQQRPGITVAELAEAMGVKMARAWQLVATLEVSGVRRDGGPAPRA